MIVNSNGPAHNQYDIRAAHEEVRCYTVEYTMDFLSSDWVYILCHGIKMINREKQ